MSKKQLSKQIREIAAKVPKVMEKHISGYYMEKGEPKPNFYTVEVNHERRLRNAFLKHGMDGIHQYLQSIHNLMQNQNEPVKENIQPE